MVVCSLGRLWLRWTKWLWKGCESSFLQLFQSSEHIPTFISHPWCLCQARQHPGVPHQLLSRSHISEGWALHSCPRALSPSTKRTVRGFTPSVSPLGNPLHVGNKEEMVKCRDLSTCAWLIAVNYPGPFISSRNPRHHWQDALCLRAALPSVRALSEEKR